MKFKYFYNSHVVYFAIKNYIYILLDKFRTIVILSQDYFLEWSYLRFLS